MRIVARMQVNLRVKELRDSADRFAMDFAEQLGELTLQEARKNVAPGKGPGPHPHITEHIDTGALAASLKKKLQRQGFLTVCNVYTDLVYGAILEMGWHTATGKFVRYPWLAPAAEVARREAMKLARATWRVKVGVSSGFKGGAEPGPAFGTTGM